MNTRIPTRAWLGLPARAWLGLLLLPSGLSLLCMPAASADQEEPLSPSEYAVSALCSTPSPGYSGCLGLRLVAREPLSVPGTRTLPPADSGGSSGSSSQGESTSSQGESTERANDGTEPAKENTKPAKGSLGPSDLLTAYNLTGATPPTAQTIGIVDAYDDANAEEDLATFDTQYGLPACTSANGCLVQVNEEGNAGPLPPPPKTKIERGWVQETSTDIEVAHGVCPSCHILLVEARTNSNADLYASETAAANLGANEISNSWGGEEPSTDSPAFNHPGIVITASAGDDGYLNWLEEGGARAPDYPASSPNVVAVGGTRLNLSSTAAWESETAWNDGGEKEGRKDGHGASGGGCSSVFSAPVWQQDAPDWPAVGCVMSRAVADVSADADPYTGVAVYDSTEYEGERGWNVIGGTSVASPIIAAVFALAGGAHGVAYPAQTLYENATNTPATLHDVISGSNAECTKPFKENGTSGCSVAEESAHCANKAICLAGPGYDGPSGVGTPDGLGAFELPGAHISPAAASSSPPSTSAPAPALPVAPSAVTPAAVTTSRSTPSAASAPIAPVVSGISLTQAAKAALNRRHPQLSKVGFAFTLSASTRVRVTILRRVRIHGRLEWEVVSKPISIAATRGRQRRQLSGKKALAPGRYELTLAPLQGSSRSIVFRIG